MKCEVVAVKNDLEEVKSSQRELFIGYKMGNNSSAVYNHSSSTGHPESLEDFEIIISIRNSMDLLIQGSLLILRDRPKLNTQTSSTQLTLF